MKKSKLVFLFLFFACTRLYAQHEHLHPLEVNLEIAQPETRSFPDIYIYEIDTLELPLKDDFSLNKFWKYNAQPGDANVTMSKFYRLLDGTLTPYPEDTSFSRVTTYRQEVNITDDTVILTPLASTSLTINTLTSYPIVDSVKTFYPCYTIVDTVDMPGDISDTIFLSTGCVVQDSVNVYFVEPSVQNTSRIWVDYFAYHNYRYAVRPPTLGVATFDGLNQRGYPYDFTSPTATGVCDFLTSKPIDLSGLTANDSVFLSFFYQPQGLGDAPEAADSLVLEFYDPTPSDPKWRTAWSVPGTTLKPFKQVLVHVKNPLYLNSAFQFRFKNYGVQSGSIDHWHVDYVFLDKFRKSTDTISGPLRDDVAFQYQASTLLNNKYTSMPLTHFETNPAGFMRDTLSVFKRNNDIGSNVVGNLGIEVSYKENLLYSFNFNPEIETPAALSNYRTVYNLDTLGIVYDTALVDSCSATFDVKFFHKTSPDFCEDNDTMRLSQIFSNYYAYDDGTAEAAYGLTADPGTEIFIANGFSLAKADVLSGVAIHFTPSVLNADLELFYLTIWDNTGSGGSPGNIIYQETVPYDVIYGNVNNRYHVYQLSSLVNVSGTIYVGFKQSDQDKINLGFDLNNNTNAAIFYNVGFGWTNTSFAGSLMIRPVFNACDPTVVSVKEEEIKPDNKVVLYPNPANQVLNISSALPVENVMVYDMAGQQLMNVSATTVIQLETLANGIYVVQVKTEAGITAHRLVVEK